MAHGCIFGFLCFLCYIFLIKKDYLNACSNGSCTSTSSIDSSKLTVLKFLVICVLCMLSKFFFYYLSSLYAFKSLVCRFLSIFRSFFHKSNSDKSGRPDGNSQCQFVFFFYSRTWIILNRICRTEKWKYGECFVKHKPRLWWNISLAVSHVSDFGHLNYLELQYKGNNQDIDSPRFNQQRFVDDSN